MDKLRYTHISRTMSEINEEVQRIKEADITGIATATIMCFCEWLCGLTDIPVSSGINLAKFAAESLEKGVPVEDVGDFIGKKLKEMVLAEIAKRGSGHSGYTN